MHTIPNIEAYKGDTDAGAEAFKEGQGICRNPHGGGQRAIAWETGWLNECQAAVLDLAGEVFAPKPTREPAKKTKKKAG